MSWLKRLGVILYEALTGFMDQAQPVLVPQGDYFLSRSHFAFWCSSWSNRLASAR
jgi:hypothetical protein